MPAVQSAIVTFPARTGTGTQTVTGVVDANGDQFIPKAIVFVGGYSPADTIESEGSGNAYCENHGLHNVSDSRAGCDSTAEAPTFGAKACAGCSGTQYSVVELQGAFGGGATQRIAKVVSVALGSFTIDYGLNNRTGDTIIAVCLGGDSLAIDYGTTNLQIAQGVTYPASGTPVGFFAPQLPLAISATGGVSNGAGGGAGLGWSWATSEPAYGCTHILTQEGGGNARVQRTDQVAVGIDASFLTVLDGLAIASWNDANFTVASGGAAGSPVVPMIFSGADIAAKCGSFTQATDTGEQTVTTDLANMKWLVLMSVGKTAGSAVDTVQSELVIGFTNGDSQASFWCGEITIGHTSPLKGCRYLSTSEILRFATPDGPSTTFDAVAELVSIDPDGAFTINWTTADESERQILWFALGDTSTPPPPPEPIEEEIRMLRRFPLPYDRALFVYLSCMEFFIQAGEGQNPTRGQGSDPIFMVRYSVDGGRTWGDFIQVHAGEQGEYQLRAVINRIGTMRNGMCELYCSDPIFWSFMDCYVTADVQREN